MASTLVVADIFGIYRGYFEGFGGSLTPALVSGVTDVALYHNNPSFPGNVLWAVAGDHVGDMAGVTGLKIAGTTYPVVVAATFDGTYTSIEVGTVPQFTVGASYTVELVGTFGSGTPVEPYAGPTIVGVTPAVNSTAGVSVDFSSTGRTAGDKLYIAVATANQAVTAPAGFTAVPNSGVGRGTAGAASAIGLWVFERDSSGTETTIAVADPGDHQIAAGWVVRGAAGAPVVTVRTAVDNTSAGSATHSAPTIEADDNSLIITIFGNDRDFAGANYSAQANSTLVNLTERIDAGTSNGNGSGISVVTGERKSAGTVAPTTATSGASALFVSMTMVVKNGSGGSTPTRKAVRYSSWL